MEKKKITNFQAKKRAIEIARFKVSIKRKLIKGTLVAITAGFVGLGINGVKELTSGKTNINTASLDEKNEFNKEIYTIDISADEALGITLVNDSYDDREFESLVKQLKDSGLKCEGTDIDNLDLDNINSEFLIAITGYGGNDAKVIANYEAGNNGSDQLAVAMAVATNQNVDSIQKGVNDLEKANGSFKKSRLEDVVGDKLIPNITVAYPLEREINPDEILEASVRLTDYYKHGGTVYDEMLYRVRVGDSPFSLSDYICSINKIDKDGILDINRLLLLEPLSKSFSPNASINIQKVNETDYKFSK